MEDIDAEKHGLEALNVDDNGEIIDENAELNGVE